MRFERPSAAEIGVRFELHRVGREYVGPCPLCGGRDRFSTHDTAGKPGLCHCRGCGDALDFYPRILEAGGWRDDTRTAPWSRARRRPENRREPQREAKSDPGLRDVALAARRASRPATATPAAAYLCGRRGVWPTCEPLPPSVRWLPRPDVPAVMRPHRLTEPDAIAGLVLFDYRADSGHVMSVKCEALAANGERLQDDNGPWKRNYGSPAGALFVALDAPGDDWHLVEGEADALAVAADLLERGEGGRVVCANGTSSFNLATCADAGDRRIVLHPDRDGPGAQATMRLLAELEYAGKVATVEPCYRAKDPAAARAARVRAASSPRVRRGAKCPERHLHVETAGRVMGSRSPAKTR